MVSPLKNRLYKLKKPILLIFILVSGYCLLVTPSYAQSAKYVRVAVTKEASSLNLKALGSYEIINSATGKILSAGANLKTTVTTYKNKILLGKITSNAPGLLIKANESGIIIIDGRKFRGQIELIKKVNTGLLIVNHIDLDDYVKGILYHEASHYWPMEALQAQAIICRTYAIYQMQENKSKDYDVTSDIYSQVYGGRTSERYRTNKAVNETKRKILTFQARVFPTYYHATCGGHTEDASRLWNINISPLKGVVCNFCKDSPHFSWHYILSLGEIKDKLVNKGYKIDDIKDMVILARDNSGRITDLKITSTKEDFKISAKDFRNIISPNTIRSANFTVNIINHDAVFEGFGWGHGVGLCQWGAYFMAKQGYDHKKILKYYYPDSEIVLIK